jgi:hypothetical protein
MTCAFPLCSERESHYIIWQTMRGSTKRPYLYCREHFETLLQKKDSFRFILEAGKMAAARTISTETAKAAATEVKIQEGQDAKK